MTKCVQTAIKIYDKLRNLQPNLRDNIMTMMELESAEIP